MVQYIGASILSSPRLCVSCSVTCLVISRKLGKLLNLNQSLLDPKTLQGRTYASCHTLGLCRLLEFLCSLANRSHGCLTIPKKVGSSSLPTYWRLISKSKVLKTQLWGNQSLINWSKASMRKELVSDQSHGKPQLAWRHYLMVTLDSGIQSKFSSSAWNQIWGTGRLLSLTCAPSETLSQSQKHDI